MAMSVMRVPLLSGIILLLSACQLADHSKTPDAATDSHQSELLQHWVTDAAPQLAANPDHYRLQILFTEIQRDQAGRPILRQQQYRADAEYLYPASTVKLAIAALALEYLQQLAVYGVSADSVMQTEPLLPGDVLVNRDESAASGLPTMRHYVKKILLVSDNDAYNRLYELMGQRYINTRLTELGFTDAQILHRLERPLSAEENRATNAITFYDAGGQLLYRQPARHAPAMPARPFTPVGNDYLKDGLLQGKPLDFSQKNRWTLSHMHRMTQLIMLPETLPAEMRLQLAPAELQFLQQQMAQLPGDSQDPRYDPAQYWPTYVKFLVYGAAKDVAPDPRVHIHNKVGDAYGFLLDSAYIRDECSGAEFILSAALYVNQDGVLNDDHYDYDTVGLPLLKRLGELALAHARTKAQAKTQATRQCLNTARP
ncbi:MAG: serine hydrolase [Chromatiaceae bacterium]